MTDDTFAALWATRVRASAHAPFLVFEGQDGAVAEWSYAQFDEIVERTAATLNERGVGRGDAVHVCLTNSPAFIALWLAVARLGAWMVPVDPASTARDLENQFERTAPVLGVCGSARSDVYLLSAGTRGIPALVLSETSADVASGSPLVASTGAAPAPIGRASDPLAVMFTSGTTAAPKGVVLSQRNYAHVARTMAHAVTLGPQHRWFVTLPLFHANAQYYCFGPAIAAGASVALTARFSASGWLASAHRLAVTHASLFAAPIRMILARTPGDAPRVRLDHVWFAQSLGSRHHEDFTALVGCAPRQLYGMTESVAIVTADASDPPTPDLIGLPVAGREVLLVDPVTLDPVPSGVVGMMIVAGEPGIDLFLEYLNDPATTARTLVERNGRTWLMTGDLAESTPSGALRFVGRADDVIKVAGENVSLTQVEATISQAPGVLEAAVVARHDDMRDQVPVAYVVPIEPHAPPDRRVLDEWAARELPPQARPREWHIISELPRTSVGKVRRFRLPNAADQG